MRTEKLGDVVYNAVNKHPAVMLLRVQRELLHADYLVVGSAGSVRDAPSTGC